MGDGPGLGTINLHSLLSKLAVHEAGVERAAYDADGVAKLHPITVEANPCDSILQHLQSAPPAFSPRRVSAGRARDAGGTARTGVPLLGPVRGDAVRAAGARPFPAGDLRRFGQLRGQTRSSRRHRPETRDAELCECASAVGVVSDGVLSGLGAVPRG